MPVANCTICHASTACALVGLFWYQRRAMRHIIKDTIGKTLTRLPATIATNPSNWHMFSRVQRTIHADYRLTGDADFVCVHRPHDNPIEALAGKTAADWVYDRTIITLSENDPAIHALETLHSNKSSCALVYDSTKQRLLGVLDLMDVVRYTLRGVGEVMPPVRQLLRTCTIASSASSLNDVCAQLRSGARYIAIPGDKPDVHQIVSQRAIAQALFEISSYDQILRRKLDIAVCDLSTPVIMTCSEDKAARRAFEIMAMYGLVSLPVCNAQGDAVAVISATDILLARSDASVLDTPVVQYIAQSRVGSNNKRPATEVVACVPSDTLYAALTLMLENKVHHIFVLQGGCPTSVVSFVDILRIV